MSTKQWIVVVKWNGLNGSRGDTQYFGPFHEYDMGVKIWSADFQHRNKDKIEWMMYEPLLSTDVFSDGEKSEELEEKVMVLINKGVLEDAAEIIEEYLAYEAERDGYGDFGSKEETVAATLWEAIHDADIQT